jgi:orotate phosphoribosyltransferase
MTSLSETIAEIALRTDAIKLNPNNPFQWASGYRMPIYNDNRMFLGSAPARESVRFGFLEEIGETLGIDPVGRGASNWVIAGTSTAGIPWAYAIADKTRGPMVYIRDKPKDHGMGNQIEGIDAAKDLDGRPTIVIEDLISTGGSSVAAVQAVRDAKGSCGHCFSIFNYGFTEAEEMFSGKRAYDKEGKKFLSFPCIARSILTYDTLLKVARDSNYLNPEQVKMLEEWRIDPFGWGEKRGFPRVIKEKK